MTVPAQPMLPVVSLSCGAAAVLCQLLQAAGWNKTPKEKHASGKIQLQLEPVIVSGPDPVTLSPADPLYGAASFAQKTAQQAWDRTKAPGLELTDLQFQTVQVCLRYFTAREDTGSNRFLAELQEAFRVIE